MAAQAAADRERSRAKGMSEHGCWMRLAGPQRQVPQTPSTPPSLVPTCQQTSWHNKLVLRTEALEDYAPFLEEGADADIPVGMPARDAFSVKTEGNMFYVEQNGRQFGPKMQDKLKATDLMIRLNQYSATLRKQADTEYAVDQIQYPEVVGEEPVGVGEAFSGPLDTDGVKLEGKKDKKGSKKKKRFGPSWSRSSLTECLLVTVQPSNKP